MLSLRLNILILFNKIWRSGDRNQYAAAAKLPLAADFAGSFTRH
jgi:hypothetical protein